MTHRSWPTSCKLHETEPQKPSKVSSNAGNKARKPRNPTSRRDSPATTLEPSPSTTTTAHSRHDRGTSHRGSSSSPTNSVTRAASAYLFNDDYDLEGPHSITTKLRTVSTSTCGQSPPWRTMTPNKAMPSTFPSLVSTSASQTSQPPQPDASGRRRTQPLASRIRKAP